MYINPLLIGLLVLAVLATWVIVRCVQASERINRHHDDTMLQMHRDDLAHAERMKLADQLTRQQVLQLAAAHHVMPSEVRDMVIDGEIVVRSTALEVRR